MSRRDPRLWFPFAFAAAGSLLMVGILALPKLVRPRPTAPVPHTYAQEFEGAIEPNRPDQTPGAKCEMLAAMLVLEAPALRVAHPEPRSGVCYVRAWPDDPSRWKDLRPEEEYAGCWRGLLLCVADPPPGAPDGDHGRHAGDFYLFGDVRLLEKVRPVADGIHFGPWRGVGGPAEPPP